MEIKNIKNQQQEAFIQNLEKGFMVSNGVYADNFINRKLGRVGQPYKKGEGKKEEEKVGAPGPLSKNKELAKQAAKYREKEGKAYDKIRKDVGKNISNAIEGVKSGDESKGITIMENDFHDGLKEAKEKYGFKECYVLPIKTGKGETVVAYAAKDKKGNISYFMSEKDLMENTTTTSYGAKNKEGSGGLSEGSFQASVLRKIREGKTEEQEQKRKDKKDKDELKRSLYLRNNLKWERNKDGENVAQTKGGPLFSDRKGYYAYGNNKEIERLSEDDAFLYAQGKPREEEDIKANNWGTKEEFLEKLTDKISDKGYKEHKATWKNNGIKPKNKLNPFNWFK